jgi:DnaK suppressor protein
MEEKNKKISFPAVVLAPLVRFLRLEEKKLKNSKKELKKADPFIVGNRDADNSVDSDVAENVEHDRSSAMRRQVTRSIIAIKKTLTRIKLGKFGICAGCGKMIDTDRLAIKPTAEYCIDCETKKEKGVL